MPLTKLGLGVLGALLAGAILIGYQSNVRLRAEIRSLRLQIDELEQQQAERERNSNRLAQAQTFASNNQLRELLKLRSEVGLLRKATNELAALREENSKLRATKAAGNVQRQPNLAAGDLVPVESLTFAGYATPEATFQSTLSADMKGNTKMFLDGFTAERRQEEMAQFAGKSESELGVRLAERAAHFAAASAQILKSRLVADDQAELTVYLTAEDNATTLTMKKIEGEWKISGEKH